MTYGTVGFGFFQDSEEFRRKVHYWHIMPACSELGIPSPGMPLEHSMATFATGIDIQNQIVLAAAAAEVARGRSG
ncbi:MAG: hypothetical protein LUQ71_00420 [Methanoregula sp.]|nr:hypothetical protein [Methanoregula sp.]